MCRQAVGEKHGLGINTVILRRAHFLRLDEPVGDLPGRTLRDVTGHARDQGLQRAVPGIAGVAALDQADVALVDLALHRQLPLRQAGSAPVMTQELPQAWEFLECIFICAGLDVVLDELIITIYIFIVHADSLPCRHGNIKLSGGSFVGLVAKQ